MDTMPKRVDENQPAIVDKLRRITGVSVWPVHMVGKGFPDIIVGYGERNYLFEIKNPDRSLSERALTKDEQKFFDQWNGNVNVITDAGQAWKIIEEDQRERDADPYPWPQE